jgi:hypothetical protein
VSARTATWLAWGLWALYLVLAGLSLALAVYGATLALEASNLEPIWLTVVSTLGVAVFATAGAMVAARRPGNPVGWLMCSISLTSVVSGIAESGAEIAAGRPGSLPGQQAFAWVYEWAVWPAFGLSAIFLLLFPEGRPLTPRWRFACWLAVGGIVLVFLGEGLHPDRLTGGVANPVGVEEPGLLEAVRIAGASLLAASLLAAVLSLLLRFRRARGVERQQLKWLAYVVATPIAVVLPVAVADPNLAGSVLWGGGSLLALIVGIPVATAIAILRYRLYDIDLIIRRTLVYGVLSALLAGLYFGIVLVLQEVFSSFAGGSDLAIAVSTLAVAALFRPVRSRIQAWVDRRFYRRKYDAQRTLEAFSARLRDEIDLDALAGELRSVVRETMQPAHVSLWLRGSR